MTIPIQKRIEVEYEFDPMDHSATLQCLKNTTRLAIGRLQELVEAAKDPTPPDETEMDDCCGNRCTPCVKTLFCEKRDIWSECEEAREECERKAMEVSKKDVKQREECERTTSLEVGKDIVNQEQQEELA